MNILVSNGQYQIYSQIDMRDKFPQGVYTFDSGLRGPFLNKVDDLKVPEKVYGNDTLFIEHVLRTWNSLPESLGILLTGKKGLGKSFTANLLCTKLAETLPVIKITREIGKGEGLIDFLNEIKQDHIIYIDEFEKIFTTSDEAEEGRLNQKVFLSFLDGGNSTDVKRLFLITTNNEVNDLFINRPTRLRYVRDYDYMDIAIVREIVEDRLDNKEYLSDLIEHVDQESINIDILIKIIDEINLHKMPYSSFKDFFNYKSIDSLYEVSAKIEGIEKPVFLTGIDSYSLNQIKNKTRRNYSFGYDEEGNGTTYFNWIYTTHGDIRRIDERHYEITAEALLNTLKIKFYSSKQIIGKLTLSEMKTKL